MHSISLFLLSTLVVFALTYDRGSVVNYAATFWNNPNHDCNGGYLDCSPYSYFGGEHCGYPGQGGDCSNFVSQSILAGQQWWVESAEGTLGHCLRDNFGWESNCDWQMGPPGNIQARDVLVYHSGSCDSYDAHAVVVVEGGSDAKIACHSND